MPTTRSLPQVVFNHLPGSLIFDEENNLLGRVIHVDGKSDSSLDMNRLAVRIRHEIDNWREGQNGEIGQVNPDIGFIQPKDIEAIKPESVEWELFPYYYRCTRKSCGIWQYRRDLLDNEGRCHRCNGPVEQTLFVWVHHCGYLTPLVPGKRSHCKIHKERSLYLYDTGTFTTSSWRCRDCGQQAQVGFLECPQCGTTNPRPQPMKWNDPGVFSSVTFQMVNLDQEKREQFIGSTHRDITIQAVLSSEIPAGCNTASNMSEQAGLLCSNCGTQSPNLAKFCQQCGAPLLNNEGDSSTEENTEFSLDIIEDLITYTLLFDKPGTSSLRHGNPSTSFGIIGLEDLLYLERFPVSLIGLGYRRQRSKRPATLCLFPPTNASKSIRVYTNSTEVEACVIRLDPIIILRWLQENNHISDVNLEEIQTHNAFEELHKIMNLNSSINQIVLGLLHTISHAYIIGLSWCSGMDVSSFNELLLPGALASVVHSGDTSIGGLSSVFFQTPWQPIELAKDDLIACQLDPICSEDDGGACIACLHLPLGCSLWNSSLSRAYLFGGETKEGYVISKGFWQ